MCSFIYVGVIRLCVVENKIFKDGYNYNHLKTKSFPSGQLGKTNVSRRVLTTTI